MSRSLSEVSRREERIFVSLPVSLRVASMGDAPVSASTVDYSNHGLRVRADVPFEAGQDIEVIVTDNGNKPKNCGDWYGFARYKEIGGNAVISGFSDV